VRTLPFRVGFVGDLHPDTYATPSLSACQTV
jgi:hypothetical protein